MLEELHGKCTDRALLLLCWASWDQPSDALKSQLEEVPKVYKNVRVAYIDCDEADAIIDELDVDTVQTLVIIHPNGSGKNMEKHLGLTPEKLTGLVEEQNSFYEAWFEQESKRAARDIESLTASKPFFIFFKGSKEQPKCKFSRRLVELLKPFEYDFDTYNILQDERIRQWLKVYTKWPTFPQVFINQKFIGGIDVLTELVEDGEFDDMVPASCKPLPVKERLAKTLS